MSPLVIRLLICLVIAGAFLPAPVAASSPAAPANRTAALEPSADDPLWTVWGADHYALADDGASIWIGAAGGVVRWDKQGGGYRRYTAVDGLPHTEVLAVAVDAAGNRWFGGNGGLSRLDAAEVWTHFSRANSGLHSDLVTAIAVVGGDTLYLSHGLPYGSVSRRDGAGAWGWFPNREAAIQTDYAAIVGSGGSNPLWTVAGDEVWAGARVFDGVLWQERRLPTIPDEPVSLAVDSRDHVWALRGGEDGSFGAVFEWDGSGWLEHWVSLHFSGKITALAVDGADTVWLGLQERDWIPYSNETAVVRDLEDTRRSTFYVSGPVAALLVTPEGLWAAGPGWLMHPDLAVTVLTDGPRFKDLPDAMAGGDGALWLYSGFAEHYTVGAVQRLDDRGTLALEDDIWQVRPADYLPNLGPCQRVTAFERAGADVWYANYCYWRVMSSPKAMRYRGGEPIEYDLPLSYGDQVGDIFAEDQRHTWFAVRKYSGDSGADGQVLGLDDNGTPADLGDDVWQTYPIESVEDNLVVAVDALGRLWHGQGSGLYRHDGAGWQLVYGERPICDLTPAADGTLYARVMPYWVTACGPHSTEIMVVHADGEIEIHDKRWLIEEEMATVQTARRRNSLWSVAADGAVWYIGHSDAGQELQRRSSAGLQTYALPVEPGAVQRLEVDGRGHVWLVANSRLWRMAGPPPVYTHLPLILR